MDIPGVDFRNGCIWARPWGLKYWSARPWDGLFEWSLPRLYECTSLVDFRIDTPEVDPVGCVQPGVGYLWGVLWGWTLLE